MVDRDENTITDASPSVQTHLGILQGVIQRMAGNSSQCKAWSITIVSAILVIVANKSQPDHVWLALIPIILFMSLDAYYLAFEKGFRKAYTDFVAKIHDGTLKPHDLYSVAPAGNIWKHRRNAMISFSVWGFYIGMTILLIAARFILL